MIRNRVVSGLALNPEHFIIRMVLRSSTYGFWFQVRSVVVNNVEVAGVCLPVPGITLPTCVARNVDVQCMEFGHHS